MSNHIFDQITQYSNQHALIAPNSTIVVGLSGGPDSVFLLHFLHAYGKKNNIHLIAAHLDHGWRKESADDVAWCRTFATHYNVPFESLTLQSLELPFKPNGSLEEIGRNARRFFLEKVAHEYKATAIALGHHANDQQETFFIRLLRGASLSGLTSMQPKNGLYIRPLLATSKNSIIEYLLERAIPYLIDPTNATDTYLRNRIRASVLPALQAADKRFDHTFAQTLQRLQETEDYLQTTATNLFLTLVTQENGERWLNYTEYLQLHSVIRQRILIHWLCTHAVKFPITFAFMQEIERFMHNSKSKSHSIKNQWTLFKQNRRITIR